MRIQNVMSEYWEILFRHGINKRTIYSFVYFRWAFRILVSEMTQSVDDQTRPIVTSLSSIISDINHNKWFHEQVLKALVELTINLSIGIEECVRRLYSHMLSSIRDL